MMTVKQVGVFYLRPPLVDIDADDAPDLFVQEETGHISFFENTGTPQEASFVRDTTVR